VILGNPLSCLQQGAMIAPIVRERDPLRLKQNNAGAKALLRYS
jgi:hypothetical protein